MIFSDLVSLKNNYKTMIKKEYLIIVVIIIAESCGLKMKDNRNANPLHGIIEKDSAECRWIFTYDHGALEQEVFLYENDTISIQSYTEGRLIEDKQYHNNLLVTIERNKQLNTDTIYNYFNEKICPKYKSYLISYNGGIKFSEGLVYYDYSIEANEDYKIGKWIYYDEKGELERVEEYSKSPY